MDEKKKVILKLDNICQSYVVGESNLPVLFLCTIFVVERYNIVK